MNKRMVLVFKRCPASVSTSEPCCFTCWTAGARSRGHLEMSPQETRCAQGGAPDLLPTHTCFVEGAKTFLPLPGFYRPDNM